MTSGDLTFESVVEAYRERLTRAAYHLCGDRDAACDIVQDTLIDAYKGLNSLLDPEKVGAWLYTILRRKALAYRKTRLSEVELLKEPTTPGPEDSESLVRDIVIREMEQLSEEDREILAGKYLLGLSYRELAEALGIKEGAVRVRCFRAKEKLREILSGAGVGIPQKGAQSKAWQFGTGGDRRGM